MSYFDDHEDQIIYSRPPRKKKHHSGKPAAKGSALAQARILAHSAFDPLWQSGRMSRSVAYRVLARQLDIAKHECHIGNFDQATCEKVIALYVPNEFEVLDALKAKVSMGNEDIRRLFKMAIEKNENNRTN